MDKSLTFESDNALLEGLRNSTPAAFEALYRRYYRMVAKQASDQGIPDAEAEDVFQEVLFILVRKVREADFTLTAKLSTFLFAIARNLILKKTGDKKEIATEETALFNLAGRQQPENLPDREMAEAQLDVVAGCLELLEDDCRRLLELSFYERRSQAEIAAEMGYSEAFVKVKKHRCLDYLRKHVKAHPLFKHLQNDAA